MRAVPLLSLLVACVAPQADGVLAVAVNQAVRVPLWADGGAVPEEARAAPVIAGRAGVVQVWLDRDALGPGPLSATLEVGGVDATAHADADGLVTFDLPADAAREDATWSVSVDGGAGTSTQPLGAVTTGPLKLRFVPFEVDGYTPDTSAAVIDGLREAVLAAYPVTEVLTSVAPVQPWPGAHDLGAINVRVGELQEAAMVAGEVSWDTYFYGLVTGVADRAAYVGATGTSEDGGDQELVRAYFAAGAAFGDQRSEDTLIHELGHVHGLAHVACDGEDDPDPDFPHDDGAIGVEGWDRRTDSFVPADTKDMMTYCYPRWISDYAYARVAAHVQRAQSYAGYE